MLTVPSYFVLSLLISVVVVFVDVVFVVVVTAREQTRAVQFAMLL